MIESAKARLGPEKAARMEFLHRPMHEIEDLAGKLDVAISVNSLIMPDVRLIDRTLGAIRDILHPNGVLLGIVPSIDAIHHYTMLLYDQALEHGLDPHLAFRVTAEHAEHKLYDFAFGRFKYQGLKQKFWQPFEVEYRLSKAGFRNIKLDKVLYPWDDEFLEIVDHRAISPSWDWFFQASL
jgi:hypothetical protein